MHFLKQSNLPFLVLVVYLAKSFFIPPEFFDYLVVGSSSLLFGWKLWLDHIKKPDISQEIYDLVEKYKEENEKLSEDTRTILNEELIKFNTKLSNVSLSVGSRPKDTTQQGTPFGKWG
jgi:hypothetical protein